MSGVIGYRGRLGRLGGFAFDLGHIEDAGLGEIRDAPDVHDFEFDAELVLEAAQLRQADVDRGLSTLEPGWQAAW
jgi:hypothetical protein